MNFKRHKIIQCVNKVVKANILQPLRCNCVYCTDCIVYTFCSQDVTFSPLIINYNTTSFPQNFYFI